MQFVRVLVDGEVELLGQLPTFGEDSHDEMIEPQQNQPQSQPQSSSSPPRVSPSSQKSRRSRDFVPFMICGRGTFLGTVGGALLLTILGTIISALGLEFGLRTIIEGSIILAALLLLREELFQKLRGLGR